MRRAVYVLVSLIRHQASARTEGENVCRIGLGRDHDGPATGTRTEAPCLSMSTASVTPIDSIPGRAAEAPASALERSRKLDTSEP